jgi:hypothetical protein
VVCGPTAQAVYPQTWMSSATPGPWVADIAAAGPGGYWVVTATPPGNLYYTVDDGSGGGMFSWNWVTKTLTSNVGTIAAGVTLSFPYTAQYPFTVSATTGNTPTIEALYTAPDITGYQQGLEMAEGLLAQLGSISAEVSFESKDTGWLPGQNLPVILSARSVNATYVTTSVRLHLATDTRWLSDVEAVNASVYQGSYLERWREMRGQGSSSGVSVLPGGTAGTAPPVYDLGGSRYHPVFIT